MTPGSNSAVGLRDDSRLVRKEEVLREPRMQPSTGLRTWKTDQVCRDFISEILQDMRCRRISVWTVDPVREEAARLLVWGKTATQHESKLVDFCKWLAATAVRRRLCTAAQELLASGQWDDLAHAVGDEFDLKTATAVPVANTSNPNQLLLTMILWPEPGAEFLSVDRLDELADRLAIRVENHLFNRCVRLGRRVNIELSKLQGLSIKSFTHGLARLTREELACDTVMVFLEQGTGIQDELEWVGTNTDHDKPVQWDMEQLKRSAEKAWRTNRELLVEGLATELSWQSQGLVVPLRDLAGRSRGAICCINWRYLSHSPPPRPFSYDDVAVVDALTEAFTPRLELCLADQKRYAGFRNLGHELHVPVIALRAVIECLEKECQVKGYGFRYDHFEELNIYSELMRGQLVQLNVTRLGPDAIPMEARRMSLLASVMAPTKRFVKPLLTQEGLSTDRIAHDGFQLLPKLHVDPGLMTQVFFNLVYNAVKYRSENPDDFRLKIRAFHEKAHYCIAFEDNGIGVEEGKEEEIFRYGVRTERARQTHPDGEGLGLWIARALVELHGGTLKLTNRANPTVFLISLPQELQYQTPQSRDLPGGGE